VRFQATHKLMSYLLVATALATLASSEALGARPALLLRGNAIKRKVRKAELSCCEAARHLQSA